MRKGELRDWTVADIVATHDIEVDEDQQFGYMCTAGLRVSEQRRQPSSRRDLLWLRLYE